MNEKIKELLRNMKSTAASRYNASKRLEARERSLIRLTGFTSAYLIGLTVLPYFIELPDGAADRLNLLTFILGVIILVASLIQYSSRDGVNAEQHYRCGLEISDMRRSLKLSYDKTSDDQLNEIGNAYSLILQKYSINHDQVDFERFKIERKDESKDIPWYEKIRIWVALTATQHMANFALALITILLFALVFAIVSPACELPASTERQS